MTNQIEKANARGSVQYINPDTLLRNPAFTQVVVTTGPVKTIYIGMQNAVDAARNIIGKGDIVAQTNQVLRNLDACLEAAGAKREHLAMWTIYVAQGQSIQPAFEAGMQWWGNRPNPPANTVIFVPAFTPPEFLIGIDAVAVAPQ